MSVLSKRALLVLTAFDYESLQLTLESLDYTINREEKVVIVLNGKRDYASERTERIARNWAQEKPDNRYVVRPLCAGDVPYFAITEILRNYEPLKDVEYICKIDDDIIPLKKGWIDSLESHYHQLAQSRNLAFTTGLINNNCWGFAELVSIFEKEDEYKWMMNYTSVAGEFYERKVPKGVIDRGLNGTILQYPYLAWWLHQWTSGNVKEFLERTQALELKQIPDNVHYSIGCIYSRKNLWLDFNHKKYDSTFDELLLHLYSKEKNLEKWAVMSEPIIHLFYRTQRHANADLVDFLIPTLCSHFNDESFKTIERITSHHFEVQAEDKLKEMDVKLSYLHRKILSFSIFKKWKQKRKIKKLLEDSQ